MRQWHFVVAGAILGLWVVPLFPALEQSLASDAAWFLAVGGCGLLVGLWMGGRGAD